MRFELLHHQLLYLIDYMRYDIKERLELVSKNFGPASHDINDHLEDFEDTKSKLLLIKIGTSFFKNLAYIGTDAGCPMLLDSWIMTRLLCCARGSGDMTAVLGSVYLDGL